MKIIKWEKKNFTIYQNKIIPNQYKIKILPTSNSKQKKIIFQKKI